MNQSTLKKHIIDYGTVLLGSFILAFAIASILKPNGLMTGGLTGLSIISEHFFNIPYTYIYYAMTLVIFITAGIFLGKREMLKITFLSIAFPSILMLMESFNYKFIQDDMILATVYYGF